MQSVTIRIFVILLNKLNSLFMQFNGTSYFWVFILLCFSINTIAQTTYPTNGVKDERSGHYALTNATIYVTPTQKLEKATLLIKDGKVVSVSPSAFIPADAVEIDCSGKTIYPSFIELFSNYGLPEPKAAGKGVDGDQQYVSEKKGAYYWNEAIKPEMEAYTHFNIDPKVAKQMRQLGFGTVLTHQKDGIARGTAALTALNETYEHEVLIKQNTANFYSFRKGVTKQAYPSSLMGSIALLRQAYLDAKWYKEGGSEKEYNISLQQWNTHSELPSIFDAGNWQDVLRAQKIADEFYQKYIIKGGGDEYRRLEEIKAIGADLILPVNFPKAYDVEDPLTAQYLELSMMKHWEMAPYNLARVEEANINFALTTSGLETLNDFMENVKKAIKNGMTKERALEALTMTPAKMLQVDDQLGSLQNGKIANFIVASDDYFENGKLLENWVQGNRFIISKADGKDITGQYDLYIGSAFNQTPQLLEVSGEAKSPSFKIVVNDTTKIDVKQQLNNNRISFQWIPQDSKKYVQLSGLIEEGKWSGQGRTTEGRWTTWLVNNRRDLPKEEETKDKDKKGGEGTESEGKKDDKTEVRDTVLGTLTYPFLPYGWTEKPAAETVLFKNATVWTNTDEGILENTDVLIRNGQVAQVGKDLADPSAIEIDATGKHLTCGIIDEHSHIAIKRGVNEGAQSCSAEVRIGDVINSDDINIYRQLSGGVTTAQLLHGSANPIGGQSAIIKYRWGSTPEEMKVAGAAEFIKCALGENVKRSNWGNDGRLRFPQSRMGVEQVFMDYFTRAEQYQKDPNARPDLELDAVSEILNQQRFITCHSYVQSEITMLMRVAEQFDFNVNTFTHILEGYKVADKMKEHGVHASTFSDWWMYKFEVNDAIPQNASILSEMGITTAINSDDAEMARRLNTEAAKSVKYGGMPEEAAWKMVTLNPAIILKLDDKLGSVEAGKDADVVLWSDMPLSVYAVAELTFVDGIRYWDIDADKLLREEVLAERNRLIQKMLVEKHGGSPTQTVKIKPDEHFHCDDEDDWGNVEERF